MHSLRNRSLLLMILIIVTTIVLSSGCELMTSTDHTDITSNSSNDQQSIAQNDNVSSRKDQSSRKNKSSRNKEEFEQIDIITPNQALFAGTKHPVVIEATDKQGEKKQLTCTDLTNIQIASDFSELITFTNEDDGTCLLHVDEQTPIGSTVQLTMEMNQAVVSSSYIVLYDVEETIVQVAGEAIPVVTNADSIAVFVNKQRSLPADYRPADLVEPNVRFSFSEAHDKRLLREEAARALEKLFAAAEEDQIELVAVSGFRSYNTQRSIYEWNIANRGEEHAKRFSAYPGTSEHQTGLAMDVSSPSVGNALDQALGDTKEGQWLADNAHRFGFIIRYPKDKESITGYAYEPWHLRYVGEAIATHIYERAITLEEFFDETIETIPVIAP